MENKNVLTNVFLPDLRNNKKQSREKKKAFEEGNGNNNITDDYQEESPAETDPGIPLNQKEINPPVVNPVDEKDKRLAKDFANTDNNHYQQQKHKTRIRKKIISQINQFCGRWGSNRQPLREA